MKLPDPVVTLLAAAALMVTPAAAMAQAVPDAAPACAPDKTLPAPWSAWAAPEPLRSGSSLATAAKLEVGHAYSAALTAAGDVTYVVPLPKPPAPGAFSGLFTLTVDTAGTYAFALGDGAWIDVAPAAGQVLGSVSHGHGPVCSGIHKVVDFALQPGAYVVQIAGAAASPVVIEIQPKP